MKCLWAVGLLAALALATDTDSDKFTEKDLAKLYKYINRIINEKNSILEKINDLKINNKGLLTELGTTIAKTLAEKTSTQKKQDARLEDYTQRLEAVAKALGEAEASLSGSTTQASRVETLVNSFWARMDEFVLFNREQGALASKITSVINASMEAVENRLATDMGEVTARIQALGSENEDFTNLLNNKQCYAEFAEVVIDQATGMGETELPFPESFVKNVDVADVRCAAQGFDSSLNLGRRQQVTGHIFGGYGGYGGYGRSGYGSGGYGSGGYGSGGYGSGGYGSGGGISGLRDGRQHVAVSCECRALYDRVQVRAFDQSQGEGNSVDKVFIQVKACKIPPNSGFQKKVVA